MSNTKRCEGYKGHWECSEEYPDHEVPRSKFGTHSGQLDGLQGKCHKCKKYYNGIRDPIRSAVIEFAKSEGIVFNRTEWRALPKAYRDEVTQRWHEECSEQSVTPEFTNSYEEVTTVSKGRKRDQKVVAHIKGVYDTCSVEGCDYPLYDVAHIHALKHGADDLPGNCIPLCPNHHRDLDRGRLLLADPADRSATDPIDFLMEEEEGRIILDEGHYVDSKYIEGCIREIDEYLSKRESY